MRLGTRVLVGLTALSLGAVACGGYGNDAGGVTSGGGGVDDGGVASETGPNAGGLYQTGSTGATGSTSTGATGVVAEAADVQVSVNNYLFDPDPVKVSEGDVVAVRNDNTRTPHTFTVVGQDVDLELAPQETETVTITLKPGTYDLICRFHETLGMKGTLIVS